jgi:hypothetical protein
VAFSSLALLSTDTTLICKFSLILLIFIIIPLTSGRQFPEALMKKLLSELNILICLSQFSQLVHFLVLPLNPSICNYVLRHLWSKCIWNTFCTSFPYSQPPTTTTLFLIPLIAHILFPSTPDTFLTND